MNLLQAGISAVERGYVPDLITRFAIRRLCRERVRDMHATRAQTVLAAQREFIESMSTAPIAPLPAKANEQHYELPPEFFAAVLGPHRKYSCCLWDDSTTTLEAAEDAALQATCDHAELCDGQDILELGCGWGSLSLWMASKFPNSRITAVSNSAGQRHLIESVAAERGLKNLQVITADMNQFYPVGIGPRRQKFDRVVSVEMFEHMRNYELLLARIATWLQPAGKLFVHLFCHRQLAYPFETEGASNWMGRYFFTGGNMPSQSLLGHFHHDLTVTRQWVWNGLHYQRTADAWLRRLDVQQETVLPILVATYGREQARQWFHRWRMFFLAVSELFGYGQGSEWFVCHYLLEHSVLKKQAAGPSNFDLSFHAHSAPTRIGQGN